MVAPAMRRMREKVEQQLKPMVEMFRAEMLPHGRLLAGGFELVVAHYEETFRVMDEGGKKLCWYEFCLTPEIFRAMGVHPFLGETHPASMALGTPEVCWDYVDAAEQSGVPPELCVLDKFLLGALLGDELPRADFIVTASAPCDSSRIGYQMFEQLTDCPVHRMDAPADDSPEAHAYYAGEIRKLIGFLEAQTGNRFDADRLREVCEESNRATDATFELLELRRARPCPHPGPVMDAVYAAMQNFLGEPALTRYAEFLRDDAEAAVREGRGALAAEKHRVLWYYTPVIFDFEMHEWLGEKFDAIVVTDLLSSSSFRQDPIDTTSVDTMLCSLARRGLEGTMGRVRVGADQLIQRFLIDYEHFGADCVVFPGPIGCKHVWGWIGLLREVCREREIPICAFDLDWMDSRVRPVQSIRSTIEQFFEVVMD
jgi:benzoyl-CoA reductase/2-hydroxyglutaryl-CoA dehydratase subunit BcrC/BadD/HgdB